ncbi:DinB family protein [Deinococcus apachensis]|uniref:DinB family protein n=1 Tax=Deinococcus apachensis TaxID=309886 RepID=UPI00035F9D6B|nr:DinB family protein [Deinococcus apachensis]
MPIPASEIYARTFQSHRSALMDLYAQLPDEQGGFSAWEGGMSFIGLADHLAGSSQMFSSMIAGQAPARPAPGGGSTTLQEARDRLAATTESAAEAMRALTPEDLARRVPAFGGREMPVSALLDALIAHEAHHKGQIWMMARMVGVKPPMFVKM